MPSWNRLDRDLVRRALLRKETREHVSAARRAAVAVALGETNAGVQLLVIRRAERARDPWSGHLALPGGHADLADANLLATVVRETREELGIDLALAAEYLGELEDFAPVMNSDLSVRPFVFALAELPELHPNAEVAEAHWLPVADLTSGALAGEHELAVGERRLRFPAYRVGERRVWGLTYRVLTTLFARIAEIGGAEAAPSPSSGR